MRVIRRLGELEDGDPLSGVANFFDLGIVFALGFLLALIVYLGLPELNQRDPMTRVKKGVKLERYRTTTKNLRGEGIRLGSAYRLKTGEVVYVPEDEYAKEDHQFSD